ncbi:hypothetical protein [Nocardia veterana]|uniref:Uncharacterized protein n=1 Tax=Nocardia veterana TaxID=132249 RepID=A0A7X6M1N9_9NOCA|nr:hypothetical protein [Nocardia veterana]NKY88154.1 hypothetical protein [Nocardia veterana]
MSFFYDIYVPKSNVVRALRRLAEHASRPSVRTVVQLPGGEQITLPFTGVKYDGENSMYMWLSLDVDIDWEIARINRLDDEFPCGLIEVDGEFYKHRADLDDEGLSYAWNFDVDEQRDRGLLVPAGTSSVGVYLRVDFVSNRDPRAARLHVWSWSTTTHGLFYQSTGFHNLFAGLVADVEAVFWGQGAGIDDDQQVHWFDGRPVPGVNVTLADSTTWDEVRRALTAPGRPAAPGTATHDPRRTTHTDSSPPG